jgi:hypothetical protein
MQGKCKFKDADGDEIMFEIKQSDMIIQEEQLISDCIDIKTIQNDYFIALHKNSFKKLITPIQDSGLGFTKIRKIRSDGNSFYRGFLYLLFEHYAFKLKEGQCK